MTALNAERLEEIRALAERMSFDLRDGRNIEGYVLELYEDGLDFGHGGPKAPEQPERILYADIDPTSMAYFCKVDRVYKAWTADQDTA